MSTETQVTTLRASSAQTAAAETGTIANGGAVTYEAAFTQAVFVLDVTALATETADKLDVYVDVSFDGGTLWVNVVHFTQLDGDGSASKEVAVIAHDPSVEDMHVVTSDLAEGATRQIGLGTQVRYRSAVTDASTDNASFTWSLKAYFQ